MQNYIVRIYRNNDRNLRELVGIVEEVGEEGRRAFTNLDELWEILSRVNQAGSKKKRKGTLPEINHSGQRKRPANER